jgi:hypothetical protein
MAGHGVRGFGDANTGIGWTAAGVYERGGADRLDMEIVELLVANTVYPYIGIYWVWIWALGVQTEFGEGVVLEQIPLCIYKLVTPTVTKNGIHISIRVD